MSDMQYDYVEPPVPTLRRWQRIARDHRGQSLLRMLEYERLAETPVTGRVLDVGGGRHARYRDLLPPGLAIESVNIDPQIEPTYVIEPGAPFPVPDATYDTALCFNTLEHIYDAAAVLAEIRRVLKPGGRLIVTVPFMFRIHGHPDDYFRATPSWWHETFRRLDFARLELQPLVWGRRSTAAVVPGFRGPVPRLRLHMAMWFDVLTASLLIKGDRLSGRRGRSICGTSPGWFIIATR